MVKVLIVDDSIDKIKVIRKLLDDNSNVESYDVAQDAFSARKNLEVNLYDLLILDINLPLRAGDDSKSLNCINLLKDINRGNRLIKPTFIIGLTEFESLKNDFQYEFDIFLWLIIYYDITSIDWEVKLNNKIDYLIQSKLTSIGKSQFEYNFDVAFITALNDPELKHVLNLPLSWEEFRLPNDSSFYNKSKFIINETTYNLLAISAPQMGMTASSVLAMKVIHSFRPRYIIMTGIAAGIEGKCNYGDILVSEMAFDYTSGKNTLDDENNPVFEPDYKSISLSRDLLESIQNCKSNRDFLDSIKNEWAGEKPNNSLELHVGPFASGGSVVEDNKLIDNIKKHNRKLIGIDMETYGIYYAANNCTKPKPLGCISIKSVSDFANKAKVDKYQNYASYTSAKFAFNFK